MAGKSVYVGRDGLLYQEMVGVKHGCLTIADREIRITQPDSRLKVHVHCDVCDQLTFKRFGEFGLRKHYRCGYCREYMADRDLGWLSRLCGRHQDKITNPMSHGYPMAGGAGVEFRFLSAHHAAYWVATNLGVQLDARLFRIDRDGHFEAGNLKWVPRKTTPKKERKRWHRTIELS